jgi:hypothetical protein
MQTTYRITISGLLISDAHELIKTIFPSGVEPVSMRYSQESIEATFASPQTPADNLGPLVKVEVVVA